MSLPRFRDVRIAQPQPANMLLRANEDRRQDKNLLLRERGVEVAENRLGLDRSRFEGQDKRAEEELILRKKEQEEISGLRKETHDFNIRKAKIAEAQSYLPHVTQENYDDWVQWQEEQGVPSSKFLKDPEDVKKMSPEEFKEYKTQLFETAESIRAMNYLQAKEAAEKILENQKQKNKIALEDKKSKLRVDEKKQKAEEESKKPVTKKQIVEDLLNDHIYAGKPLEAFTESERKLIEAELGEKPASKSYEEDKSKLVDDTRGYYSILMKTLLDDVGDVKPGKEEEYAALTDSLQEDMALIAEGKKPKWLERKKPVVKPKPTVKKLTKEIAGEFMDRANNNIEEARRLAKEEGYSF